MRIALVADRIGPLTKSAAADVVAAPLSGALRELGHQVTLYACELDVEAPAGVEVVRLRGGYMKPEDQPLLLLPESSALLARRWSASRPDVVHAMTWTAGLTALAALRDTAGGGSIPLVQTFDRLARQDGDSSGRARLEAAIARSAAAIVARSAEEAAGLTQLGVPRAAIAVVPCGVDLDRFTPEGPAATRTGRQRVVAFGPLDERLGPEVAVRALRRAPGAELVVVGGPDPDRVGTDPAARRLLDQAARCRVGERVRLAGAVPEAELAALLRSADVAVRSTTYERSGAGVLAAMACGVPVVASEVGALADIVAEGATGDLVPPGQPEAFVAALRDLLGDPTKLAGYRIGAADRARARYGWNRIAADVLAVYRNAARVGPLAAQAR
jgi:glycosyltransferase involved in cell wall biosynthesis